MLAGRYQLGDPLGHGSSATVWAGTDLELNQAVVVKVFDASVAADPHLRARFQQQAAKAALLDHPHIAAVLEAGFTRDFDGQERPYVITEVAGPINLRALLDRDGRLSLEQSVQIARQLASALSYAHSLQVVHANVKPENVQLDERGQHARLVDFSLSFVSTTTGFVTPETIVRRAAYLAPEQVRGEAVGPATDVYGLGVLLYEMALGRPPFLGPTPQTTAERRVREAARPVGIFDPSVPPALDTIVSRALERSPAARWASMAELEAALGGMEAGQLRPVEVASMWSEEDELSWRAPKQRLPYARVALLLPLIVGLALLAHFVAAPLGQRLPSVTGGIADALAGIGAPDEAGSEVAGAQTDFPNLVGMDVAEAWSVARSRGLEIRVAGERETERFPKGTVIQQSPQEGQQQAPSQPLRVTLSAGVRVPDVRGKSLAEARVQLASLGWEVESLGGQAGSSRGSAVVVRQTPSAGELVATPGELKLELSD